MASLLALKRTSLIVLPIVAILTGEKEPSQKPAAVEQQDCTSVWVSDVDDDPHMQPLLAEPQALVLDDSQKHQSKLSYQHQHEDSRHDTAWLLLNW